ILFVVGWVKAREWGLTRTMVAWTLSIVLAPVLIVGAGLAVAATGLVMSEHFSSAEAAGDARPELATRERVAGVAQGDVRGDALAAQADPGTLEAFRGRVGQVVEFRVRGRTTGTVYGTDTYTDDSDLATAAVHAGVLRDGGEGVVRVTVL